jgi:Kef-type K+ transport system membrane component KefB
MLAFRDVFATFFFISVGALLDPARLAGALPWLGLLLALVVIAKVLVAYVTARALRLEARWFQLALGLGQIGEFSFVLGTLGAAPRRDTGGCARHVGGHPGGDHHRLDRPGSTYRAADRAASR